MTPKHINFVCPTHGIVATTFSTARVWCGKCKANVECAPDGLTVKEHLQNLKDRKPVK